METNILHTVSYINDAYQIAEQQLNQEMREYSQQMAAEYRVNPVLLSNLRYAAGRFARTIATVNSVASFHFARRRMVEIPQPPRQTKNPPSKMMTGSTLEYVSF